MDEVELESALDRLDGLVASSTISNFASPSLLEAVSAFIRGPQHAS
jgi:hypothetical protein